MSTMYDMFGGGAMGQPVAPSLMQTPMNQMQKVQMVINAMRNPGAFLKQRFPDIPDEIMNDPNRILSYLQQTRGITDQQIQQTVNQYGGNMHGKY